MKDDLITPENLSNEFLKSIFDDAYMDSKIENDEVKVKEEVIVRIQIDNEKDRMRLLTIYRFDDNSSEMERLICSNNINSNYILVSTSVYEDILVFYHDIIVSGGVPKKIW
ncbi:MAG: hypothetical protein IPH52_18035 [Leptospiraceae bacterium]|nr:hypothetical protein [Leptospiraceae bacterium]